MNVLRIVLAVFSLFFVAGFTNAQITVDGTVDAAYGTAAALQTVNTGFGDNESEWNGLYAVCDNDRLYLTLTGNLQQNFNKLEVFFDTVAGGENVLSATPDYDFGNTSTNMGGMTFDTGFEADYHLFVRGGSVGGSDIFDADFVNRAGGGSAAVASNGVSLAYDSVALTASGTFGAGSLTGAGGDALTSSIELAFDNNNTAGISGIVADPIDQAAAAAVTTGLEVSIALADLGLNPAVSNTVRIAVMQNNGDHNFLSNQFFGGLPANTGNLGGDGMGTFTGDLSGIDLNNFAGDQFVTLNFAPHTVPEPGSAMMLAAIGLAALARRRR